jgi:hypothetical protein
MRILLYTICLLLFQSALSAQERNTDGSFKHEACHVDHYKYWKILSKVKYKSRLDLETGSILYTPIFHELIKQLDHKEIIVTGYLQKEGDDTIITAFPSSNCCWGPSVGPESSIKFSAENIFKAGACKLGDKVCMKGVLKLKQTTDFFIYSFQNIEILENKAAEKRTLDKKGLAEVAVLSEKENEKLWQDLVVKDYQCVYNKEDESLLFTPEFSKATEELDGKKIIISGYYLKEKVSTNQILTGIKINTNTLYDGGSCHMMSSSLEQDQIIAFEVIDEGVENNDAITVCGILNINRDDPSKMIYYLENIEILRVEKRKL